MKRLILLFILMLMIASCSIQKNDGFIKIKNVLLEEKNNTTNIIEEKETKPKVVTTEDLNSEDEEEDNNDEDDNEEEETKLTTDKNEITVKTPDGDLKIVMNNANEWCIGGSIWDYTVPSSKGTSYVQGKVTGIITDNNELNGLCEIFYSIKNPDGTTSEIYNYFNKSNDILYAKDLNGTLYKK